MKIKIIQAEQPVCRAIDARLSELEEAASVEFWLNGQRYRLTSTPGFIFDGASIPWLLWTTLGLAPHGIMDGPSWPHDLGYETQGVVTLTDAAGNLTPAPLSGDAYAIFEVYDAATDSWTLTDRQLSKRELDELLRQLCRHYAITKRSRLVWLGVKLGGGPAWRSDDKSRKYKLLEAAALTSDTTQEAS
jgi:hypothetical protein